MSLFGDDFGIDNSPEDGTEITTTILYYSEEELKEFKRLIKIEMKKLLGEQAKDKGNISDTLLTILKQRNGTDTRQEAN
jgi:hypothetical protein